MADVLVLANETIGGGGAARRRSASATRRATRASTSSCRRAARATATSSTTRRCATPRRCASTSRSRSCATRASRAPARSATPTRSTPPRTRSAPTGSTRSSSRRCPPPTSGWLRRDLPERLENETGLPVKHIVVDVDSEGLPFDVTLVLANQTAAGGELVKHLEKLAEEGPHRFIVVVPQDSGDGRAVRRRARAPAASCSSRCESEQHRRGGHDRRPRPLHGGDERAAVLPHLRGRDLHAAVQPLRVGREGPGREARGEQRQARPARRGRGRGARLMEAASISQPATAGTAATPASTTSTHHGPPEANRSSRVEPQLLGMLLFIISEVMVFGAFFTAYFFIRVVGGAEWPAEGDRAAEADRRRQHGDPAVLVVDDALGARVGQGRATASGCRRASSRRSCSARRSSSSRSTSTSTSASRPQDSAQGSVFYGLTGLHGAHVFVGLTLLAFTTIRAFRGPLHARGAPRRRGARASTGTSST